MAVLRAIALVFVLISLVLVLILDVFVLMLAAFAFTPVSTKSFTAAEVGIELSLSLLDIPSASSTNLVIVISSPVSLIEPNSAVPVTFMEPSVFINTPV